MRTFLVSILLVTATATVAVADDDEEETKPDKTEKVDKVEKTDKPDKTDKVKDKDPPIGAGANDKGTFGIGLMMGEPTGVCGKLYLSDDQALQFAAASAFFGGGLQLHADYVFHPSILQARESFVLAAYIGPGVRMIQYRSGRAVDTNYFAFGLRVVGGLLFDFKSPLDAFIEVAGVAEYGLRDDKGFGFAINAAAGVRYYF